MCHLTAVLSDPREARRVKFTLYDLVKQRVFHIAAGYKDAKQSSDANALKENEPLASFLSCLKDSILQH